jgi:cysteine desulfurase/selenocysteine lyase
MVDLSSARDDFPALAGKVWFDNGTVSLTPAPVAEAVEADLRRIFLEGPPHVLQPGVEWPRRERTLQRIAAFLGTSAPTIALMRGVSEAYQTVLRGIDWEAGDELIISDDEEAAVRLPSLHLGAERGVQVRRLPYSADPDDVVRSLESLIGRRTRLIALSHVTTTMGWVYPIAELSAAANGRGVPLFADLAHSGGLMPYRLPELGCDLAGVLSYKWMFGPYASGALYVRPDALIEPALRYAGNRSERYIDPDHDRYELREDAARYQYGPWAWPLVHGWARALEYLSDIGVERIWRRTQSLVNRLHDGLADGPHVTVVSPRPPLAGALVTFALPGASGPQARDVLLNEHRIRIKAIPGARNLLRASIPFFATDDEIDLLSRAVSDLGRQASAAG